MKNLVILAALLLTGIASAEVDIEKDAFNVAYEIRHESPNLSPDQRNEIAKHFLAIHEILQGARPATTRFLCVSKDNDNRAPYAFAIRESIHTTMITDSSFSTEQDCKTALAGFRTFGPSTLGCVARDTDGRAPFQVAKLEAPRSTRISHFLLGSLAECNAELQKVRATRNAITFCGSRDEDNRAPFIAGEFNLSTGQVELGNNSFPTMDACHEFLGN